MTTKRKKKKVNKKADIFKLLKKRPKKVSEKKDVKVTKTEKKTLMQKANYILATMRFKRSTIILVRNLSKKLGSNKRLTAGQSKVLNDIYAEWIAGRPKIIKKTQKGNKKAKTITVKG